MTARQEQVADLLFLRLFPLRRLFRDRIEAMYAEPDAALFDEAEYSEEAYKLVRLEALIARLASRLPPDALQPSV